MRWISLKSRLLGHPLASSEAEFQLLPKTLALPVFASDPLSSVAYATEEAMLVLALAGVGAFVYLTPVSFAVAGLLAIVVISYRQTIRAYPEGGGAFGVSYENLGVVPGAVAAASLLVDYVLTVAVSVSAGVAAITSAIPELLPWRVTMALGFVSPCARRQPPRGEGGEHRLRSPHLPVHHHDLHDVGRGLRPLRRRGVPSRRSRPVWSWRLRSARSPSSCCCGRSPRGRRR